MIVYTHLGLDIPHKNNIVFTVGATPTGNPSSWIRIDCGDKQIVFKVISLFDSQKHGTLVPFAFLNDRKEIDLNEDALKLLKTITKPVAVLIVSGPCCTGKSYYLSRFLGDRPIFKSSDGIAACTRGMMMATTILECEEFAIVLMDAEATGSIIGEEEQVAHTNFIVLSTL